MSSTNKGREPMDQTRVQALLNTIEDEAREAVHAYLNAQIAKGKDPELCAHCVEARVQGFAADLAESALGDYADEHMAELNVADFMMACAEDDEHAAQDGAR